MPTWIVLTFDSFRYDGKGEFLVGGYNLCPLWSSPIIDVIAIFTDVICLVLLAIDIVGVVWNDFPEMEELSHGRIMCHLPVLFI